MTKAVSEGESSKVSVATLRRLAVKASCDPRTIKKLLDGDEVGGLAGERARAALIEEGLLKEDIK